MRHLNILYLYRQGEKFSRQDALGSLKSSILSLTSSQLDETLRGAVEACRIHTRGFVTDT